MTPIAATVRPWYVHWLRAVTRPTVGAYRAALAEPGVGFGRAMGWVVAAAVMGGLVSWGIHPGFYRAEPDGSVNVSVGLDLAVAGGGIASFVLVLFLEHAAARALGGRGSYAHLAYLSAPYAALFIFGPVLGYVGMMVGSAVPQPDDSESATPQ